MTVLEQFQKKRDDGGFTCRGRLPVEMILLRREEGVIERSYVRTKLLSVATRNLNMNGSLAGTARHLLA
jgi:hypothetical protein